MAEKISTEQIQLICDLLAKGNTEQAVADVMHISKRTVQRYKNKTPATAEAITEVNHCSQDDYTTRVAQLSSQLDKAKQLAKMDKTKCIGGSIIVYPEDAPPDWLQKFICTGIPFAVSPVHDKDVYAKDSEPFVDKATGELMPAGAKYHKGELKKAHIHIEVLPHSKITYKQLRELAEMVNAPRPEIIYYPRKYYDYLTHANESENSEKHVYTDPPTTYNDFVLPLDSDEKAIIRNEIRQLIYTDDITEYGQLVSRCHQLGQPYFDVVKGDMIFFDKLVTSYRANPIRNLKEVFNELADYPDKQEKVGKNLTKYLEKGDNYDE